MKPRHRRRHDRVAQRRLADQHVIGGVPPAAAIDAKPGRGVALGIEIDDQHLLADGRERGAEIDRGRGLADAALLIGDGKDAGRPRRSGCSCGPAPRLDKRGIAPKWCIAHRSRPSLASLSLGESFSRGGRFRFGPLTMTIAGFGIGPNSAPKSPEAPTFSGLGQFSLYILSLGKHTYGPLFNSGYAAASRSASGAKRPRGHDLDGLGGFWRNPQSARMDDCRRARRADRFTQKGGLLGIAFDQMDARAGRFRERAGDARPGKPAPEPRSAQIRASGPAPAAAANRRYGGSTVLARWKARSD